MMIVSDVTSWGITLESSITLLESSIMLLENINCAGITQDDCNMFMVQVIGNPTLEWVTK